MTDIKCKRCDRSVDPDSEGRVLDGQLFCLDCLNRAGLGMLEPEELCLGEEVEFAGAQLTLRALWAGVYTTTVFTFLTSLFLLTTLPGMFAARIEEVGFWPALASWHHTLGEIVSFGARVWLYLGIFVIPICCVWFLVAKRYRRVLASNGLLLETTRKGGRSRLLLLEHCTWTTVRPATDLSGYPFPGRRCIFVSPKGNRPHQMANTVLCGFTKSKRLLWTGYLQLFGVPERPGVGPIRWARTMLLGLFVGGVLGVLAGHFPFYVNGPADWIGTFTAVGMFDGMAVGALWLYWVVSPMAYRYSGELSLPDRLSATVLFGSIAPFYAARPHDEATFAVWCVLNAGIGYLSVGYIRQRTLETALQESVW